METKTKGLIKICAIAAIIGLFANFGFARADIDSEINDINSQIKDKQKTLESLKKQADSYLDNINAKQNETVSLQNQLSILENKIAKAEIDIQTTEATIEKTQLEIKDVAIQISNREADILKKDDELQELVRLLYKSDQQGTLQILLANDTLSDFFDQVKHTKSLQGNLQNSLISVKSYKAQLESKKDTLNKKNDELDKLRKQAEQQKIALQEELDSKGYLLKETKNSEEKFYNLYWQTKQEQQNSSAEIYSLEKEARLKLEELENKRKEASPSKTESGFKPLSDSTIMWPIKDISRGISATFHDPTYPFRHLFEHPGIDVRAYQSTAIYAASDGYVISAKDNGYGYNYISIMHANGISTVYGHVSKILVKPDQYVIKGQQIGQTGGMPGTLGAGNLSTGPHLHFEVRLNGIPVNPLDYLPDMGF
ncbi:MAG TPA: peptidoglycan DD-metalloendopeptidase family protein [Candidatus Bipolaricaulota bacterium]|nr:peptidoglycan DD-metalloendopeptidase family protein [Candidatus Bipolaricaulota bacterium]